MSRPLIQIDDIGTAREMTKEEYLHYCESLGDIPPLPGGADNDTE